MWTDNAYADMEEMAKEKKITVHQESQRRLYVTPCEEAQPLYTVYGILQERTCHVSKKSVFKYA